MLVGRMRARRARRLVAPRDERVVVVRGEPRREPFGERGRIGQRGVRAARAHPVAQVVRDVTAADHEHAFAGERRERAPDVEVVRGVAPGLHGELDHRHVRVRIHVQQRHPGAVVEAATTVRARGDAGVLQEFDRARRHVRRAGRAVADLVERVREAAEVVDRLRLRIRRHHRQARLPVRGRDEHRARARQLARERRPRRAGLAGIDGAHRRTVREEEGGEAGHRESGARTTAGTRYVPGTGRGLT